jgi:hypothetical protein
LNAAEMKSQPRSPQWKGKGREVSMDVDSPNPDNEEMFLGLSSSNGREASMTPSSPEVSMGLSSSEEKVNQKYPAATNPLPSSPEVRKPPQASQGVYSAMKTPDGNMDGSSQLLQHRKLRQREPATDPVKAGVPPHGDAHPLGSLPAVDEQENNEPRRSTRNIKPVNNTAQVSIAPPPRKFKGRQQKKTASIVKSETFPSRPHIIGSKYMQVNVIDLTQVEVSQISLLYF